MNIEEFTKTYCAKCDTQRCEGIESEGGERCQYRWNLDSVDPALELKRLKDKIWELSNRPVKYESGIRGKWNHDGTCSNKISSLDTYCEKCHTKLIQDSDWWVCPECGCEYRIAAGDPSELTEEHLKEMAKNIAATPFYPDTAEGKIISFLEPTLTITNCEKFKVQLREVDIEFELEPNKLENIDTLIINGYKYVKEK